MKIFYLVVIPTLVASQNALQTRHPTWAPTPQPTWRPLGSIAAGCPGEVDGVVNCLSLNAAACTDDNDPGFCNDLVVQPASE